MPKGEKKDRQSNISARVLNGAFLRKILYVLLLAWALLPLAAGAGFICYGLAQPDSFPYLYQSYLYGRAPLNFYGRLFFILGTATLLADILYMCAFPRKFVSILEAARKQPWHILLGFVLLWSILSLFLSASPLPQFLGSEYQYDGLYSYFLFAGVYLCAVLYTDERGRMRVLRTLTAVSNLCCVVMLGQAFKVPLFQRFFLTDRTSVFFNRNHFAYYLCTSILCLAGLYLYDKGLKRKIWYLLSFAFQLYALLLNDTFGSYLAVLFALPMALVFFLKSGRGFAAWIGAPVALFLLVNVLFYTNALPATGNWKATADQMIQVITDAVTGGAEKAENSGAEAGGGEEAAKAEEDWTKNFSTIGTARFFLWAKAARLILQHPLFGTGPDGMPESYDPDNNRPHNSFLQVGVFMGIPAMLAYLAALLLLAVRQWKRLKELRPSTLAAAGGTACYLISSFFGVPMFYTTPYLFLCLGMTCGGEENSLLAEPPREAGAWIRAFEERLIFWTSGVLIVCFLIFMMLSRYAERGRETIDTTNMNLAATQANAAKERGAVGEYWYEPEGGRLLPVSGNVVSIVPYGRGTALKGAYYIPRHLNGLPYDEARDYRGSILRVTIDPARYGDALVMDWVYLENYSE